MRGKLNLDIFLGAVWGRNEAVDNKKNVRYDNRVPQREDVESNDKYFISITIFLETSLAHFIFSSEVQEYLELKK